MAEDERDRAPAPEEVARFAHLPPAVDPAEVVIEIPAFEDDRPAPPPVPPAAAPELVAATQVAQASGGRRTIHRTQVRAGLLIAGVPIAGVVVVALLEILFGE
ncbi:hypothetical protein DEI92_01235 [Curtobacterium sp. MCBD17_034]|uniref:hypothetical protein n=1 Tax=unclassified Curtobacterium TaxID=257496 RepID=UPI000DA8A4B3|nr:MULTISPECIES: hypothetical protein [unclassified Curtobacterium]PZE77664.1 hypothetical protein DEI82_02275 [Curtobacterium sp. MCBD17_019]PZF62161.1 hypothetical protein DEI92_01235 [Curtobacterium sp. MCBD17_034]PZM33905.1 hypothetical protein DEI90_09470 [Curtobacterium sp. MCBD17_031]WIE54818.1 hypothetical protein DEI88_001030 [Curtobacterium sp. MCBD17_003]